MKALLLSALLLSLPHLVLCKNYSDSSLVQWRTSGDGMNVVVGHGRNCSTSKCAFPFHCRDDICHYEECSTATSGCKPGTFCNINRICAAIQCTANHSCPEYFKCKPSPNDGDGDSVETCVPCEACKFCGNEGCDCRTDSHCEGWKSCENGFCSAENPPPPSPKPSVVPFAAPLMDNNKQHKSKAPLIVGITIGVFLALLILAVASYSIFKRLRSN